MSYYMSFLLFGLMGGLIVVSSNPSPYFAALGLVVVAGFGCGLLTGTGAVFLSLVLFLIYLGGMMVVFAYSAALAAEPYPEGVGSRPVALLIVIYLFVITIAGVLFGEGWFRDSCLCLEELEEFSLNRGDVVGVSLMYEGGGGVLCLAAFVLFVTLLGVLEVSRGLSRGSLRVV